MSAMLIEKTKAYNPKELDDAVLQDDFKIVGTWYSSLKKSKKIKHSENTIISLGEKIMRELLKRKKVTFYPEKMKPLSKEFSLKILERIVKKKLNVEEPHGDLIFEGKEKGLLLGENLPLDDIYLLVQDGRALGYIRFGAMPNAKKKPSAGAEFGTYKYRLDSGTFKEHQKFHRVSDEEKEVRWPDQNYFWLYPIRDFFSLKKPITLVKKIDTKLPSDLVPEDINPDYLKELSNFALVKVHGLLHHLFDVAQEKKRALESIVNAHAFVVDELFRRKMEHRPWSELDKMSEKYQIKKFQKPLDYLQDFLIRKPYALTVGSVFVCGEGNDLDVVVRGREDKFFKEAFLHHISRSNVERVDFLFEAWISAFTNCMSIYDYGLTRSKQSEVFLSKIKLYDLDLQLPTFTNPEPKVYYKQSKNLMKFYIREDIVQELDGVIEFRIKQMLPMHCDTKFSYGKYIPAGYEPIYWETFHREPELEMITMAKARSYYEQKLLSKIKIGKYFAPMKPGKAAKPGEPATFESYLKVFKSEDFPVYLQKKYDGMNVEVHRSGNTIKVISEDGEDVTKRVPQTIQELLRLNHNKFIILAETEFWKGKYHYPRERAAGYFHSKDEPDDSNIVFNIYDVILTGSHGDITKKPYNERFKVLETFNIKQKTIGVPNLKYRLNLAPTKIAKNPSELKTKSQELRFVAGSEGIVAKPHWGIYDLSGRRTEQVKFHNAVLFTAKVIKRVPTKVVGVYTYRWVVESNGLEASPDDTVKVNGRNLIKGGRTDSTKEKFSIGDLIGIEAETFNYVINEKTGTIRISAWVPRVMKELPDKSLDSVQEIIKRARENHVLTVKVKHPDGTESYIPQEEFKLEEYSADLGAFEDDLTDFDIISLVDLTGEQGHRSSVLLQRFKRDILVSNEIREREKKYSSISREKLKTMNLKSLPKGFFILANHFRGKSTHLDFRIKENEHISGWTISNQVKGAIKKPIDTLEEAKKAIDNSANWKFKPGMSYLKHVWATKKPAHPLEWLAQVADIHKEGEVGATRFEEGVFWGEDWGLLYFGSGGKGSHGTSKPWFHEYFLRGKKYNGKLLFRLTEPPKEGAKVKGLFWQCWMAKTEYPYILNPAARRKRDWLPPSGRSALPPEIEELIPEKLRYWKMKLSKERKFAMLDEVYNYLIDEGYIAGRKILVKTEIKLAMTGKKVDFILQYEWWKGPEVVRGQRQNKWFIKLQDGSDIFAYSFGFHRPDKLTEKDEGVMATIHKVTSGPLKGMKPTDWMKFEGEILPGHPGHPKEIKKLPLHVEVINQGKVQVIEDGDMFKSFKFEGKSLKGYYVFRREGPESNFWVFSKSKLPVEKGKILT